MKKYLLLSVVAGLSSSLISTSVLVHNDITAGLASLIGAFATTAIVAITLVFTNK